ncbi:MAG: hypothetical protein HRT90_09200 [Candidatus Margulisbacteria bacterium]|nr:hypothetical protein [Candidatus Margulisiibacteriota bacterium]
MPIQSVGQCTIPTTKLSKKPPIKTHKKRAPELKHEPVVKTENDKKVSSYSPNELNTEKKNNYIKSLESKQVDKTFSESTHARKYLLATNYKRDGLHVVKAIIEAHKQGDYDAIFELTKIEEEYGLNSISCKNIIALFPCYENGVFFLKQIIEKLSNNNNPSLLTLLQNFLENPEPLTRRSLLFATRRILIKNKQYDIAAKLILRFGSDNNKKYFIKQLQSLGHSEKATSFEKEMNN